MTHLAEISAESGANKHAHFTQTRYSFLVSALDACYRYKVLDFWKLEEILNIPRSMVQPQLFIGVHWWFQAAASPIL